MRPGFITAEFFELAGNAERDHAEEARLDEMKAQLARGYSRYLPKMSMNWCKYPVPAGCEVQRVSWAYALAFCACAIALLAWSGQC
jgi:hypothetical protein